MVIGPAAAPLAAQPVEVGRAYALREVTRAADLERIGLMEQAVWNEDKTNTGDEISTPS